MLEFQNLNKIDLKQLVFSRESLLIQLIWTLHIGTLFSLANFFFTWPIS